MATKDRNRRHPGARPVSRRPRMALLWGRMSTRSLRSRPVAPPAYDSNDEFQATGGVEMFGFAKRRDARLAAMWERALSQGNDSPVSHGPYAITTCLGQVVRHRQRARTGTKVYVRWHSDGSVTAAWFEASRPAKGAYVLATGRYGHGPHHTEPVFYVGPSSWELVDAEAPAAYLRHQRREAKAASRRRRSIQTQEGSP